MKNLKDYIKELTIITFGLIIAFWVDNYREKKSEDQSTKQILINIKQDIITMADGELQMCQILDTIYVKRIKEAIADVNDCQIDSVDLVFGVANAQIFLFYLKNSGFESLKSSGLMTNIEDDTLIMAFNEMFDFSVVHAFNDRYNQIEHNIREILYETEGLSIGSSPNAAYPYRVAIKRPATISKVNCGRLLMNFIDLHDIVKDNMIRIKHNANSKKSWIDRLNQEIDRK